MPKFKVIAVYKNYGEAWVEAENAEEARELVECGDADLWTTECGQNEVIDIEEMKDEGNTKTNKEIMSEKGL